jgi:hypothetical protein
VPDPLARVRKLLAKAEDPACTPQESAAFTAKAAELIAKYGVDAALAAASDPGSDPVGDRIIALDPPYALDKCGLLAGVATALRCRCVRLRGGAGYRLHLFGHAADLERAELLFTSLLVQAAHGLVTVPSGESPAAYRRSWLAGFTAAIVGRLRQLEDAAGSSCALVLADRSALVDRRLTEVYPRLGAAGRRRLAGGGVRQGYAAGQRADLGTGEVLGSSSDPQQAHSALRYGAGCRTLGDRD